MRGTNGARPARNVLVSMDWVRRGGPRLALGHASLLAALHSAGGIEVVPLEFDASDPATSPRRCADVVEDQLRGRPGDTIVAFGVYVWNDRLVRETIAAIRSRGLRHRILLGGPQISFCPGALTPEYPGADLFVRGHAEQALCAIAEGVEPSDIPGVEAAGYDGPATVAEVATKELVSPILTGVLPVDSHHDVRLETVRGCPFQCSYCQHGSPGPQRRPTRLSADRILREIEVIANARAPRVSILDPVFNADPRSLEFLEAFRRHHYQGQISCQCRLESLSPRFLDACEGLDVLLEFGLQTTRAEEAAAVQRSLDLGKVDRTLGELRTRRIDHQVSLIFGLPAQTLASFEASVAWCLSRDVPVIKAFPLLLLRGTPLDRSRDRWGFTVADGPMPTVVSSTSFNHAQWRSMARLAAALRHTEGHHPPTLSALRRTADSVPSLRQLTDASFRKVS